VGCCRPFYSFLRPGFRKGRPKKAQHAVAQDLRISPWVFHYNYFPRIRLSHNKIQTVTCERQLLQLPRICARRHSASTYFPSFATLPSSKFTSNSNLSNLTTRNYRAITAPTSLTATATPPAAFSLPSPSVQHYEWYWW
jgi:hypothetical protein